MALEGVLAKAALDALPKEIKIDGEITISADNEQGKKGSRRSSSDKGIVHHYKITRTQTVEVDDSVNEKDNVGDEVDETKTTKKRRGCFSSCFGKRD